MYYELKRGESLGTLISYAGGFLVTLTQNLYVYVERQVGNTPFFNVNEFDMRSFRMADEDSVSVDSVIPTL